MQNSNQQVEQEHILYALLSQNGGLIPSLVTSIGADLNSLLSKLQTQIGSLPQVQGGDMYYSQSAFAALSEAEKAAQNMKDEYISVEHLMLGIIRKASPAVKSILSSYGITEKAFLEVLKNVRNSRNVTTDNPEDTYDALKK